MPKHETPTPPTVDVIPTVIRYTVTIMFAVVIFQLNPDDVAFLFQAAGIGCFISYALVQWVQAHTFARMRKEKPAEALRYDVYALTPCIILLTTGILYTLA